MRLLLFLLLLPACALAQQGVPALQGRVTDVAGALSDGQTAAIDEKLAALERDTGAQLAVLLVGTTRPEPIEQFALRVAEAWQLGRRGVDDGALLVIALDDRELRIEVGYGLEGALTDATANRIIDEAIVPHFRNGDLYGGLAAGVDRMVQVVRGEPLPAPAARRRPAEDEAPWPMLAIGGIVLAAILGRVVGRLPGALASAGLSSLVGWWLSGILLPALLLGFFVLVFGLGGGFGGPGGWVSGGRRTPGGWGTGGGFGGGGFSGGGGGFGGGGASGRW